ncbi:TonB-dependent receptor SusC [termite gut metagenome]|uniref:TonB-dependent receptor SusC n=1 Tax=termite gut metagenome TaxID=433724 RepID=A0A5J4RZM7_9ZZZZ
MMLLSVCFTLSAQQTTFTITGTVYDETGATLQGATVYLKDKISVGTSSDVNGKFSIKATRGNMLVFSFMGYQNVEYLVTEEKRDLEIRLTDVAQELDEVVVTALGSQRKISSLAAVTSIDVKDLQTPVASVANLLGGRVAGIISMQTSGEPGKNLADFWVRGIGTFGANASALVLIDGLEGDINSLDPADIESFSVLKDASATAVYGVRGANGVVLITTKRGDTGKLNITARVNYTLSHLNRMPQYLRAYDYAQLAREAREVRGESSLYNDVEMDIIQDGTDRDIYPNMNWQDEVLQRNSFKQSYYVSARGGAQVAKYFLSLGGSSETAAYKQDKSSPYSSNVGYNTYSYRANIDLELSPSTTLYFGTDGFLSIHNEPGVANTDYIWQAQSQINPLLLPAKYSNGQYPAAGVDALSSPYVMINRMGRRSSQVFKGKFTLVLNQDLSMLAKGLKFRLQGAYDINSWFNESRLIQPELYQAVGRNQQGKLLTVRRVASKPASYGKSTDQFRKYHLESTINYDRVFSEDHRVSGLVYYYMSDQKKANDGTTNLNSIPVRYQGISSRLTYGFQDTYMMDVNFGYTGSENFQPGRQYGFFPSIALGWVPTSYQWVTDNLPWISFFKIRGSYGTVGNDRLTSRRFPYLSLVNTSTVSPWGSTNIEGVGESTIGADNLEWEKAIKANIGFEGHFIKDKLSFVVDIFKDQRDGIFQQRVQVPKYVGLVSMPFGNVGKMQSYGTDGNVSYMQNISKDMNFTIRGNFTYSKNNVQNWEEANPKYPYQEIAGYPYGIIRGYQAVGLFSDQYDIETSPVQTFGKVMPGDIKYRDVNGDGQINGDDRVPLSYSTYPLLMYGFGGEFRYKAFSVGVLFKGTGKTDYFHVGQGSNGMGYVPFHGGESGNVLTIANDPHNRWIPLDYALEHGIDAALAENPNARFPRLQYGYNSNNSQLSDFWKGDSRYLRLQEITINYNYKNYTLQKIGISSIDFQLVGSNLYTWDKVKMFDPEQAQYNGRAYPIPATYSLQIYINL